MRDELNVVEFDKYQEVMIEYRRFLGIGATLNTNLNIEARSLTESILQEGYLGSRAEIKMNDALRIEGEKLFPNDDKLVQAFINEKRSTPEYLEEVKQAAAQEVRQLVHNPSRDISSMSFLFNSDITVNNQYIQAYNKMLMQAEQKFTTAANEELIALNKVHERLNLPASQIEALIVVDGRGDSFLRGDYQIQFKIEKDALEDKVKELKKAAEEEEDSKAKFKLIEEIKKAEQAKDTWFQKNTVDPQDRKPIDDWKQSNNDLNDRQLEALELFKEITLKSDTRIGRRKLATTTFVTGADYFKLPGVLRTGFGHVAHGNLTGYIKKKWNEATKVEVDDTDDGIEQKGPEIITKELHLGLDGAPMYTVPVLFRGQTKENQSTDLFTIYAMEVQNGLRYEIDSKLAMDSMILLDTVDGGEFYRTMGIEASFITSKFAKKGGKELATLMGEASNVSRMIHKMMKARVFSITQEYGGTIKGKDINRLVGTVSGYTAFASMAFKGLGAANNWITGNVASTLEAFGGEFYNGAELAKAKLTYYSNIGGIAADMSNPVKVNKVNQVMGILNVQSEDLLHNEYERSNKLTKMLKGSNSLMGYSMGEHEIHATVMLAMLEGQKVLNRKGEYLDKHGKVTKDRANAASVMDAFVSKEGVYGIAEWAEYTEFDTVNKLSENGLASMRELIKDRIVRTQGAFDAKMQSQMNRLWYGKLFTQFKKHIIPQTLNRFRGVLSSHKETSELSDDDKYFNLSAKTEEYGYMTSFLRLTLSTIKQERFNLLGYYSRGKDAWSKMSKHEKSNVKKAITELQYILYTYLLASMAAAAADDDDDKMWALAYLLRRQVGEGGFQYLNPFENWRMLDSPMSAYNKLGRVSSALGQLLDVNEVYHTGTHRNDKKLNIKVAKAFIIGGITEQFDDNFNKQMHSNLTK